MRRIHTLEMISMRVGRAPFWRVALALVFAVALALAILVSGLFLILLPVVLVGAIAARVFGRRVPTTPSRADVIEAEYEVIEERRVDERGASGENRRDQ